MEPIFKAYESFGFKKSRVTQMERHLIGKRFANELSKEKN